MIAGSAAPLLAVFDYAGAALFGVAAASRYRTGGVLVLAAAALAAGLAGAGLRDLVLGAPSAFLADPVLPALVLVAAGTARAFGGRLRPSTLTALEAAGGAVVAAAAASKAAIWGAPPLGAAALGVLAGIAGTLVLRSLGGAGSDPGGLGEEIPAASTAAAVILVLLRVLGAGAGLSLALAAGGGVLIALTLGSRRGP